MRQRVDKYGRDTPSRAGSRAPKSTIERIAFFNQPPGLEPERWPRWFHISVPPSDPQYSNNQAGNKNPGSEVSAYRSDTETIGANLSKLIIHDHNNDGRPSRISAVHAWAGTGVIWTLPAGFPLRGLSARRWVIQST